MRVFLLPKPYNGEHSYCLSGKDYHYLIKVLRLREGAIFAGRDSLGNLYSILVNSIDHKSRRCMITCTPEKNTATFSEVIPDGKSLPEIHLYQSILKGKKTDQVVRQITEIGITRFIPVQSEFTVSDIREKSSRKKERWETIRDEALQQSGSAVITKIDEPLMFDKVLEDWDARGLGIFFHQEALSQGSLSDIIREHATAEHGTFVPIALMIGPEGGFSDDEVQYLLKAGFKAAFLKTNILRAETAAIYASACTQFLLQEFSAS